MLRPTLILHAGRLSPDPWQLQFLTSPERSAPNVIPRLTVVWQGLPYRNPSADCSAWFTFFP
jgi:hypothetical protein